MAILMNTPASFSGSRDQDLLKGKEGGEGREIWLGIFVVCNFSYLEILDIPIYCIRLQIKNMYVGMYV